MKNTEVHIIDELNIGDNFPNTSEIRPSKRPGGVVKIYEKNEDGLKLVYKCNLVLYTGREWVASRLFNKANVSIDQTADEYIGWSGVGSGNQASATYATISGGSANVASFSGATIGGGYNNTASARRAAIGGGRINTASANYSTVGGGSSNIASGSRSTVSGGENNTASSYHSSISGGQSNNTSTFDNSHIIGSSITSDRADTTFVENLSIKSIPTASAGLPVGSVWSNAGVLNIIHALV
jgi:hypothetical protein